MAKTPERNSNVKTPSDNGSIDTSLSVITNSITSLEDVVGDVVAPVFSSYNSFIQESIMKPLVSIEGNFDMMFDASMAQLEMLMAIAGVLYGEPNINTGTKASSLLSKLGNLDTSKNLIQSDSESEGGDINGVSALIRVAIEGLDGANLEALENFGGLVEVLGGAGDGVELSEVATGIDSLSRICKALSKVPFKEFDDSFISGMESVKFALVPYGEIAAYFKAHFKDVRVFSILSEDIEEGIQTVGQVAKRMNDLYKVVSKFINNPEFGLLSEFSKEVSDIFIGFGDMSTPALKVALGGKVTLSSTKLVNDIIASIVALPYAEMNKNIKSIKKLANFVSDISDVYKNLGKSVKYALLLSIAGKSFDKSSECVKSIFTLFTEKMDLDSFNKKAKDIKELVNYIKQIEDIFKSLAVISIIALPIAALGNIIVEAADVLIKVVEVITKGVKDSKVDDKKFQANLKEMSKVIITCSLVMLLAAMGGTFVMANVLPILGFATILGVFIGLILLPFVLYGKWFDKTIEIGKGVSTLILVCAGVMMIGVLFMLTGLWKEALLFGATLAAFIGLVLLPILVFSIFANDVVKSINSVGLLIVMCAGVMMLGALFMSTGLWKEALLFGVVLMAFMSMVLLPVLVFSMFGKRAMDDAKQIGTLIIILAGGMMLGALFMLSGLWKEALEFTGLLFLFITAALAPILVFSMFAKDVNKMLPLIIGLVVASSLMLMLGATVISRIGVEPIMAFVAGTLALLGGMVAICWLLREANISMKDLAAMAVIEALTLGASVIMGVLAGIVNSFGGDWNAIGQLAVLIAIMEVTIVATAGIAIAVGAMASNPFFWIGVGAMASVVGIALVVSIAIKNIAESLKIIQEVSKNGGIDMGPIKDIMGSIGTIGTICGKLVKDIDLRAVNKVSQASRSMTNMIYVIGKSIADISDLTITEYNDQGKEIGKRHLKERDFDNAAKNINTIVTVLGNTIMDIYERNPQMFESKILKGGFLGLGQKEGKTPFEKVVTGCSAMGRMIAEIAAGVKDYAELRVPEYDNNGKVKGYRKLVERDFTEAATNIGIVVSTLGKAVLDIYNIPEMKEMFDSPMVRTGLFSQTEGTTPFEKVVMGCTHMGEMLSSVADGIKTWLDPVFTDADIETIGKNVAAVMTSLSAVLNAIYNSNPALYETPHKKGFWGNDKGEDPNALSPAERVIYVTSTLGEGLSNIVKGIKDATSIDQNLINDLAAGSGQRWKNIVTLLNAIPAAVHESWKVYEDVYTDKKTINSIVRTTKDMKSGIEESVSIYNSLSKTFAEITSDEQITTLGNHWVALMGVLADPFSKDLNKKVNASSWKEMSDASKKVDTTPYIQLVDGVNRLDIAKADKFIELAESLSQLSSQMGDISKFAEALDSKLNETLIVMSQKLDEASKTIAKSDELQNKRAATLKENANKLKDIMNGTMKIEVNKAGGTTSGNGGGNNNGGNDTGNTRGGVTASVIQQGVEAALRNRNIGGSK